MSAIPNPAPLSLAALVLEAWLSLPTGPGPGSVGGGPRPPGPLFARLPRSVAPGKGHEAAPKFNLRALRGLCLLACEDPRDRDQQEGTG